MEGADLILLRGQLPRATRGLCRDPFPTDKLQLQRAESEYLRDSKGFDEEKSTMPVPRKGKASLQNTTHNRTCSFSFCFLTRKKS